MGMQEIKHNKWDVSKYRRINTVDVAGLEAKGSEEREKGAGTAISEKKLKWRLGSEWKRHCFVGN